MRQETLLSLILTAIALLCFRLAYLIQQDKYTIEHQALIISGQESTIAAYKENLTSCLKDSKIAAQDEFTGE